MNIPSLKKLARDNGLNRIGIGFQIIGDREYYIAECWGEGIGEHNFTSGNGSTIYEAIANALELAREKRAKLAEAA